jgi:hypothetical protein
MNQIFSNKKNLLTYGATHVTLQKDGVNYDGVYNGLSYWGKVFQGDTLVSHLETDWDDDFGTVHFTLQDFRRAGFTVV